MLVLLGLLYFSHHLTNASPLPIIFPSADPASTLPTCLCPSNRSTWDIFWSCVATIFACTWVSIHPNIPGQDEGWFKGNFRRLELTLWTLVAPELIINWAIRQWIGARRLQRKFRRTEDQGTERVEWTNTHGHFLQMGGFMLMNKNEKLGVIDAWKLESLLKEGKIEFPSITEEEIQDHSNSDGLSKGLAIGQTAWFIAQCVSRKQQGLLITELELVTLAFAALNALIYFLWWNKPQDVSCPVPVYLLPEPGISIEIPEWKHRTWSKYISDKIAQIKAWFSTLSSRLIQTVFAANASAGNTHGALLSRKLSALGKALLVVIISLPVFIGIAYSAVSSSLRDLIDKHNVGERDMKVAKFYTFYGSRKVHKAPFYAFLNDKISPTDAIQLILTCFIGTLFGGIHCFGWDFEFPTHAEHVFWKVCSLTIAGVPFLWLLFVVFYSWQDKFDSSTPWDKFAQYATAIAWVTILPLGLAGVPIYIIGRLGLLSEAFIALRALPQGAYDDVQWTSLLPHI